MLSSCGSCISSSSRIDTRSAPSHKPFCNMSVTGFTRFCRQIKPIRSEMVVVPALSTFACRYRSSITDGIALPTLDSGMPNACSVPTERNLCVISSYQSCTPATLSVCLRTSVVNITPSSAARWSAMRFAKSGSAVMPLASNDCSNASWIFAERSCASAACVFSSSRTKSRIAVVDGNFVTGQPGAAFSSSSPNLCSRTRSNALTSRPEHGSVAWCENRNLSS